jgi:hypothetical protein
MMRQHSLVLPQKVAEQLRQHLFPGDGLEAAALLLCAQAGERRKKLLGREIIAVPYNRCARTRDFITWPGEYVEAAIDRAALRGDVAIAAHSHPGGLYAFSSADDESDRVLMGALWHGTERMAGSAIMIPNGAVRARVYERNHAAAPVDLVMTAGADILSWWHDGSTAAGPMPPATPSQAGCAPGSGG